ncbi:hypothetical protein VitviT2T_024712 [Vitis vinifera]|uniref:Uncharacterized protein n=1 Tax=Vitis vinifera TaxID=29760 RepID=A0ABY9DIK6_VITVI|nr:hypothetical protein VitviT2T_024712 [Vitis vinifera]
MCYIPHYFPMLASLRATINISNSTILFPGHPSSILIAITIVGDRQLLHNAPLQRCSSTQDRYASLPHHHRPSPTITTSITKSFPLFKKTLSTAMEIHVVGLHQDRKRNEVAIAGSKSKVEYIRSELRRHMKLRLTQEIRFIEDESLEQGSWVIAILDRMKNEKKMEESQDQSSKSSYLSQDDDWEGDGDDPNENIIHIK